MTDGRPTEWWLVRHAPTANPAKWVYGALDLDIVAPQPDAFAALSDMLPSDPVWLVTPLSRTRSTLEGILRARGLADPEIHVEPAFAEQDFGAWEGMRLGELPDIGPLNRAELACHAPPDGESFAALCARCTPALIELASTGGRVALIAHAGTIRAALALAIGSVAAGLAFEIVPLSLTAIRCFGGEDWAIGHVNRLPNH